VRQGYRHSARLCVLLAAAALALAWAAPARALVLHPGSTLPASAHPADAVVGRWGDESNPEASRASCVAVAPNYVLTTRHQGLGTGASVWMGGVQCVVAEIMNHVSADIRVVRLTLPDGSDANLSAYVAPYASSNGEWGKTMVLGGYGKGRGATLYDGGVPVGYAWAGTSNDTLRWGQNKVTGSGTAPGTYPTSVLTATFESTLDPACEAGIALWDSGGGWFLDVDSGPGYDWRLAGLCRAAGTYGASLFGDYQDAVRVSTYSGWINGILAPSRWASDSAGLWTTAARWTGGVPNADNAWAVFGDVITQPRTVTVTGSVTVGTLRLDSAQPYTISGSGTLYLTATNAAAGIEVNREGLAGLQAAHTVACNLVLQSDLVVNQRSMGDLTISGRISGARGLTKSGTRTLVLSNSNTFTGGLTITAGTVRATAAGALGAGAVTVKGGTLALVGATDLAFANVATLTASATIYAGASGGATARTMTLAGLTVPGGRTLTVAGDSGCGLRISGAADLGLGGGVTTLNVTTADLTLAGGAVMGLGTLAKTGAGRLTLGGSLAFGDGTAMTVAGGQVRLTSDAGSAEASPLAVTVTGGSVVAAATQHLASLTLTGGAAAVETGGASVLVLDGLTIDPAAAWLDVGDGGLIIDYTGASPAAAVAAWLREGLNRAGGYWDGGGIRSSVAAADAGHFRAVGLLDNADPAVGGRTAFMGQAVDATSLLVRMTWWGDINLDGVVDGNDYDVIDKALVFAPESTGWWLGDLNYDGRVDGNDYDLIDNVFVFASGTLAPDGPTALAAGSLLADALAADALAAESLRGAGATPVPEPATLALVGLGLAAMLARRRRRNRSHRAR
jgi:autotransporter-associated beta strand protein